VTSQQARDWASYRQAAAVFPDAAERGRLIAAHEMAENLEARKRVEDIYGVEFCRLEFPEAYKSGTARFLERVRWLVPW
jgi:hypothetical protein